jgi:hypothetical protein
VSEASVVARIGLISGAYFRDRLFALPETLARAWGPVAPALS